GCGSRPPPRRGTPHAAPAPRLSVRPPTVAVLPSADSATDQPCAAGLIPPVPNSLAPLLAPHGAAAGEHPCRAEITVVIRPAHDGGVAVGGHRDGPALLGGSNRASAEQLGSLLPEVRQRQLRGPKQRSAQQRQNAKPRGVFYSRSRAGGGSSIRERMREQRHAPPCGCGHDHAREGRTKAENSLSDQLHLTLPFGAVAPITIGFPLLRQRHGCDRTVALASGRNKPLTERADAAHTRVNCQGNAAIVAIDHVTRPAVVPPRHVLRVPPPARMLTVSASRGNKQRAASNRQCRRCRRALYAPSGARIVRSSELLDHQTALDRLIGLR